MTQVGGFWLLVAGCHCCVCLCCCCCWLALLI